MWVHDGPPLQTYDWYGRFVVIPYWPHWQIWAYCDDNKHRYTGLQYYRKLTALRVAQGMFLAEIKHWGPHPFPLPIGPFPSALPDTDPGPVQPQESASDS